MYSGVQDSAGSGTGTLNPALLNSANANPSSSLPSDVSPRGTKRSRSPTETFNELHTADENGMTPMLRERDGGFILRASSLLFTHLEIRGDADNAIVIGDGKPRKRGRPMKPPSRTSGGVSESPTQQTVSQPAQNILPQTPQQQTTALPLPLNSVVPAHASPPKTTPSKPVVKALPTVRDHTTDQLGPEGDEYIPREYDEAGEKKVGPTGHLNNGREYKCRTFFVPGRGDKLFMLATECARVLGYRDSYLLFNKNRSLYKIIATQEEKENLIHQEILPFSYRSRQIAIVTAKSMFRQFGSRVVVNGRRVRDDYWETKARKQGFTEADLAGEKRPGGAKARDAAAAEATANATAMLGHQGDVVYSSAPVHFNHPQPQTVQPGMLGPAGGGTPLPMITLTPDQNELRLGEYRNVSRPRQEITGPAYQDRTQTSPPGELLTQSHHAAEYNKQVNQQRNFRGKYIEEIWRQPHEPLVPSLPPTTSLSDNLPSVTQSLQSPHQGTSNVQQPMLLNQPGQSMISGASYTQPPHQPNPLAQTPMRGVPQGAMRSDQMHGRSPSLSLASTGMGQGAQLILTIVLKLANNLLTYNSPPTSHPRNCGTLEAARNSHPACNIKTWARDILPKAGEYTNQTKCNSNTYNHKLRKHQPRLKIGHHSSSLAPKAPGGGALKDNLRIK
ncbi:hypothetical protein VF21_01152 [Pseudogymnoascus sp. 05NY08]|nr:hypothetical protein VF21_01152 [Pseudogymnoascus sp. 05NY08]